MEQAWQVTRQRQTVALDPDTDTYTNVVEVTFRTKAGDVASVNIPVGSFNADTAKAKIDAMVDHLNAVRGISADG